MLNNGAEVKFSHDLSWALKQIALVDRNRTLAKALRSGAMVIVKYFRSHAPQKSGLLKKQFKPRRRGRDENNNVIYQITSTVFYLRFLEKGTDNRIEPMHLVQKAHDNAIQGCRDQIQKYLIKEIQKDWRTTLGRARR